MYWGSKAQKVKCPALIFAEVFSGKVSIALEMKSVTNDHFRLPFISNMRNTDEIITCGNMTTHSKYGVNDGRKQRPI